MITKEHFALEAHPRAATLYVAGEVSVPGLLAAMRRCGGLAPSVWLLRVDLSAAGPLDQGTLGVLWHSLRSWREARSGATQIAAPAITHFGVTEALHAPCKTMTRRSHFARMLTQRR
jgi:ABC-type transporter Mla MlaB component